MESLMQVMAAKKRELSVVRAEKNETSGRYLRRGDVEALLEQKTKQDPSTQPTTTTTNSTPIPTTESSSTTAMTSAKSSSNTATETTNDRQSAHKKRKLTTDSATTQQEEQITSKSTADSPIFTIPLVELKKRLRALGQPVLLFGEALSDRIARLRRAEHDAAWRQEEQLGAGHETRNQFVPGQLAQAEENADDAAEDALEFDTNGHGSGAGPSVGGKDNVNSLTRLSHTHPNGSVNQMEVEERTGVEEDDSDADKLVFRFFKHMLALWERDLETRPDQVKRTAQGKIATKTMKQCKDYIRPLFKLCKQRQVPDDILPNLVEIVKFCKQGEFVMANDAYIKLAIGNAAWPIGVTMVGIHERTGREKINSNKQAHVMNNEAQRKYLTSVKRLISYAQSISNVLPSKKVS